MLGCSNKDTNDPPAELEAFAQESQIQILWKTDSGKGIGKFLYNLSPYIQADQIYVADYKGRISAYNKTNGKKLWSVDADVPISTGIGGGGHLLYIGTTDGRVIALEQSSGKIVWESSVTSEVLSVPVRDLGVVIVRSVDGNIQALSADAGEKLWSYKLKVPALSLRGSANPLISSGRVICGTDDGQLVALSLLDGRVIWKTRVAMPSGQSELHSMVDIDYTPLVDQGIVYAAAFQGRVTAVAADQGQTLWARDKSVHLGLGLDKDKLYAIDDMSHVWALDRNTGATIWVQEKLHARPTTPSAIYQQYVLLADFEGYVHVLSKDDGRFVARLRLGNDRFFAQPVVDNGVFYLVNRKGKIYAIKIAGA